jgi:assimilatory nitrate reductase catalytic subunit
MATAVSAYNESFGFDAPPYSYADFEESDVIVLVGSNLCIAHPILWERVCRNPHQPEIVVVDPRASETAMAATRHLAIEPRSDLYLFYALAHVLIEEGWIDREYVEAHTEGFEEFARHVAGYSPERVVEQTGIAAQEIRSLAELVHQGKRVSFWWTMGVNQGHEATRVAQSIINLALLTGNMGRPGTGANSITGQCNAMGSRLFSNTTNLLGGHDFTQAEDRAKVAGLLGLDPECIPDQKSLAYDEIVAGIEAGRIRGLWVVATNGADSWIDQERFRETLKKLDFLVVQDLYANTATARRADLVLPAAGWGEKEGTFINSERRIGLLKKVLRAPGEALADFHIFRLVAEYWGCGALFERWKQPEDIFDDMKRLSEGQPCDITGIRDYRMLDEAGGIQWPFTSGSDASQRERRLFEDGRYFRAGGRALFAFEHPKAPAELPDSRFPFVLLTGRGSSTQWHTQTRTAKSAILRELSPQEIYVEINPEDAAGLEVAAGEWVELRSRRGALKARAVLRPSVRCGQLFVPMHYAAANRLTHASFDPYSRQPSYKHCAVALAKLP